MEGENKLGFYDLFNKEIGIDLGTANTLVTRNDKKIILREPSVVAMNLNTHQVVAVGEEAKQMIGRTPGNIKAIRPLRDGVIADFTVTEKMIKYFIRKTHPKQVPFGSINVAICVPSGVTEVEKKAVIEAAESAGAKKVMLIEEPMAAAIGAGLPIEDAFGSMVVDIGGGTTEIAVISYGGIVLSRSIRVGGDELDEAIVQFVRKEYNLMIGERTAEDIKINIGSAYPLKETISMEVTGRNLLTGLPKTFTLTSKEILLALKEPINSIVEGVRYALERTPPELSSDIIQRGIMLTGGGAMLKGLDILIKQETLVPVIIAENPLDCVAIGTGLAAKELRNVRKSAKKNKNY